VFFFFYLSLVFIMVLQFGFDWVIILRCLIPIWLSDYAELLNSDLTERLFWAIPIWLEDYSADLTERIFWAVQLRFDRVNILSCSIPIWERLFPAVEFRFDWENILSCWIPIRLRYSEQFRFDREIILPIWHFENIWAGQVHLTREYSERFNSDLTERLFRAFDFRFGWENILSNSDLTERLLCRFGWENFLNWSIAIWQSEYSELFNCDLTLSIFLSNSDLTERIFRTVQFRFAYEINLTSDLTERTMLSLLDLLSSDLIVRIFWVVRLRIHWEFSELLTSDLTQRLFWAIRFRFESEIILSSDLTERIWELFISDFTERLWFALSSFESDVILMCLIWIYWEVILSCSVRTSLSSYVWAVRFGVDEDCFWVVERIHLTY